MRFPILLACAAALSSSALGAGTQYSISAPGTVLAGYVTGASIAVSVVAPVDKHAGRIALKLNGVDVTSALQPDAGGSMSGTVDGLQPGANTFELFAKHSKEPLASLTVMKALAPAVDCASLASLAGSPVPGGFGGKVVTQATLTAATSTLPEHCLVRGMLQERTGVAGIAGTSSYRTTQHYGTLFEVRLPTAWNGRYMFQGSGGTEGGLPGATGQIGGTGGVAELKNGFVVASQNGGHSNSQLPASFPPPPTTTPTRIQILSPNMFLSDAQAVKDWAYNSDDLTTHTPKLLNTAYFAPEPTR